jgi:hypothetical protein
VFSTFRPVPFHGFETDFAAALDVALGGRHYTVERAWESADSHCFVLDVDGLGELLLKKATPSHSLAEQVAIYHRIAEDPDLRALFPAFHGAVSGFEAILLEFIRGETVRNALKAGHATSAQAGPVLDALLAYHRIQGAAIGDFHGGNVMLQDNRVVLIDPSAPDRHGMDPGEVPLTTDLGHWVASGGANFMSDCRRAPLLAWRLFWFNRRIFRAGLATSSVPKSAVMAVARRHLAVLHTDSSRLSRIAYYPGRAYLELLALLS